jgi:protein TonB
MKAKIQGAIVMEAVVQTDGRVGEVRVVRSLDKAHGLDDEAVKTVKRWRFEPGKKEGVGVPVLVEIEMTFSLRK